MLQRLGRLGIILSAVCLVGILPSCAQTLTLSEGSMNLQMLEGGPLSTATALTFTVTTAGAWTATSSDKEVVSLDKTAGNGNASITVQPVYWHGPGNYNATVTVSAGSSQQTVDVTLEVIARAAPNLTYIDGPHDCTDVTGFAPGNAALCTVPNEKPPGDFTPPDPGGSYIDPNFGATVRILADNALHGYSTPTPISANSKYAFISQNEKYLIVDLASGAVVHSTGVSTVGFEGAVWDAVNENYLYGFVGSELRRYDVRSDKTSVVKDYSGQFQTLSGRGTAEKSKDDWLAFYASPENQICTVDLNTVTTYCADVPARGLDYPTMAKGVDANTGKRYVVAIMNAPPFLLYSVNMAENRLDLEMEGPENVLMDKGNHNGLCEAGESCIGGGHSDTMEDSQGNQYLVGALEGQSPCEYALYSIRLGAGAQMGLPVEFGGGLKRLMPLFRCGGVDHWVDFHTGCATLAPDCVISITSSAFDQARDPNDTSPINRTSYMGEILVVHDNGVEIRRLAEHRSVQFKNEESNGYWSTPRGAISPDGAYVLATSNFGEPNHRRVIVVETGFNSGQPSLVAGDPVLNAASYESWIGPESLAVIFGNYLASCTKSATFPLPLELCGIRVLLEGIQASIFSVTPNQIAFLVPDQVPTAGDVVLEVETSKEDLPVLLEATLPDDSVTALAPAIFAKTIAGAPRLGALLFDPQWQQRPLRPGEIGVIFAIGLGATNPPVNLGDPSPMAEPLARVVTDPGLYINNVRQSLLYAGLVPGMSGVYQIVFTIDPTTPVHPDLVDNQVWLNLQGTESSRLIMELQS